MRRTRIDAAGARVRYVVDFRVLAVIARNISRLYTVTVSAREEDILYQHASSRLLRILLSVLGRLNLRGTRRRRRRRREVYPNGLGRARRDGSRGGGAVCTRHCLRTCGVYLHGRPSTHGRASPPKLDYGTLRRDAAPQPGVLHRRSQPACYYVTTSEGVCIYASYPLRCTRARARARLCVSVCIDITARVSILDKAR